MCDICVREAKPKEDAARLLEIRPVGGKKEKIAYK